MLLWGVRLLPEMHRWHAALIDSLADAAADFSSATSVLCRTGWYGASLWFCFKVKCFSLLSDVLFTKHYQNTQTDSFVH